MARLALTNSIRRSKPVGGRHGHCDVFINHRGPDTKKTVASLLYKHLNELGFSSFLDNKSMKPGDRLFDKINPAIKNCKVGVAIFSERYCESYFCLHELALMMESGKKVVPIFWDVKPADLKVVDNGTYTPAELQRFRKALEEAKYTVGLAFDSRKCDWSEIIESATDAIVDAIAEVDNGRRTTTGLVEAEARTGPAILAFPADVRSSPPCSGSVAAAGRRGWAWGGATKAATEGGSSRQSGAELRGGKEGPVTLLADGRSRQVSLVSSWIEMAPCPHSAIKAELESFKLLECGLKEMTLGKHTERPNIFSMTEKRRPSLYSRVASSSQAVAVRPRKRKVYRSKGV